MKKSLIFSASFVVLGALFVSPLQAMNEEKDNISLRQQKPLSVGKKCSVTVSDDQQNSLHVINLEGESALEGLRALRNIYLDKGEYSKAIEISEDLPTFTNLEDSKVACFLYLYTEDFVKAYQYSTRVINLQNNAATFEDYYRLVLSDIGREQVEFSERCHNYVQTLEEQWKQNPEAQFFVSYLKVSENSYRNPTSDLVRNTKALPEENSTAFIDALRIYVLVIAEANKGRESENVKNLKSAFYKKYSKNRVKSEMDLIYKIDGILEVNRKNHQPRVNNRSKARKRTNNRSKTPRAAESGDEQIGY